jgi:TIR domain
LDVPESVEADQVRPVRVFMSYRRADDRHFIGRLHDRLCLAFGEEKVFRDIDSIPPGTNFRQVILRTLDEVDVVVAVIGPNWARSTAGDTAAASDYVFMELIEALKHGKPVLPVLIEDTPIPSRADLPTDLGVLRDINAIAVRADPAFRRDSDRLIEAVNAIVAEDRARVESERQAAEERARQAEAERAKHQQHVEQLRAEERAARAHLAELEEVATRRQIELERDRLEAIEEQLRGVDVVDEGSPTPILEPSRAAESKPARVLSPTTDVQSDVPAFELLIIAALVLGVVGLFVERTVVISDSSTQFNEMVASSHVDVLVLLLNVATAVPLFLGKRAVERRFVLAGIAASTFLFEFVQASGSVRFGIDGYDEGAWYLVRIAQIACLVGAYLILRKRDSEPISSPPRYRVPLTSIAVGCAALLIAATYNEWNDVPALIDAEFAPDKSPLLVWLVLIALLPGGLTVVLAIRGTYAAQVSLFTIATLGVLSYLAEAGSNSNEYTHNGSTWGFVAMAYALLAVVAWSVVSARAKSSPTT